MKIPSVIGRRAALASFILAVATAVFSAARCTSSHGGGLPRRSFEINGRKVTLEIAASDSERERGLMFRDSLPEDEGMIFLFPDEIPRSFWMKNCRIDISIAYIDNGGRIVSIVEMKKPEPGTPEGSLEGYPSGLPAQFAIEMRANWFSDHGVKPGMKVDIPEDVRRMTRP
jgi:uncharacterized membrane protein (UPF0127 family)